MVHSEQMLRWATQGRRVADAGRRRAAGLSRLQQRADITIRDVGIFRRVDGGRRRRAAVRIETAYVAELEPRRPAPAASSRPAVERARAIWLPEWSDNPAACRRRHAGSGAEERRPRPPAARLARLATQQLRLVPGDVRLVGWTDETLPGMEISPRRPAEHDLHARPRAPRPRQLPPVRPDTQRGRRLPRPGLFEADPDANAPMHRTRRSDSRRSSTYNYRLLTTTDHPTT